MRRTKGTIYKRGSIYWARWYSNGKEFKLSTTKTNRKDAQEVLDEWVAPYRMMSDAETVRTLAARADDMEAKAADALRTELPLVKVWRYFKSTTSRKHPRASTMQQYEFQWGRFRKWLSGNSPDVKNLEQVNDEITRAFTIYLRESMSGGTTNKYRNLLIAIWNVMKADGLTVAPNPWKKIAAVEDVQNSRRELTLEELRLACQSAKDDLRPLLAIGLYTGLRLGDCCSTRFPLLLEEKRDFTP